MIDFNKYNKGLRLLAALFDNIKIFDTNTFCDIYTSVDFLPENKEHVYLLYKNPLYDGYIIKLLTDHKGFINTKAIQIEGAWYTLYIFAVPKDKLLYYEYIKSIGGSGISSLDMLNVCIVWKEYLNQDFNECYYIGSVKQSLVTKKGTVNNSTLSLLIALNLFSIIVTFTR